MQDLRRQYSVEEAHPNHADLQYSEQQSGGCAIERADWTQRDQKNIFVGDCLGLLCFTSKDINCSRKEPLGVQGRKQQQTLLACLVIVYSCF